MAASCNRHDAGLIGWVVINLAMAYKQHEMWGHVSASMVLVCLFQVSNEAKCNTLHLQSAKLDL